jgi:hypothetical protein
MTLLEFDLDHTAARAPDGPARRSGRHRPLLLLALVVAALTGAVLRTVSFGSSEPPASPVAAVLTLTDLALSPDPVLGLRLELTATSGEVQVDRLRLSGGGADGATLPLGTLLPAGRSSGFDLETPLLCKSLGNPDLTGTVLVRDPDAQLWREVPVVATGLLHGPGGACGVAANQALPPGWDAPLPVSAVRVKGPVLTFTVTGLGSLDRVQGVSVDGTVLSPTAGNRATGVIAVLAPEPDCTRPDTRPFVPTGVRVLLTGPSGMVTRYAALGPVLAQWLRSARADRCPRSAALSGG